MAIFNEIMVGGVNAKDCTATSADILKGKTAAVGKEIVTGTMSNNGNVNTAISNGILKSGFTTGGKIANLTEANIKNGVTICGKTGTLVSIPDSFATDAAGIDGLHCIGMGNYVLATRYSKKDEDAYNGGVHRMNTDFIWNQTFESTIAQYIVKRTNLNAILYCRDGNDGSTSFYVTSNGGTTWNSVSLPRSLYRPSFIEATNKEFLIYGSSSSSSSSTKYLFQSADGVTWNSINIELKPDIGSEKTGYFYKLEQDTTNRTCTILKKANATDTTYSTICTLSDSYFDEYLSLVDVVEFGNNVCVCIYFPSVGRATVFYSKDKGSTWNSLNTGISGSRWRFTILNDACYFLTYNIRSYIRSIYKIQNGNATVFKEFNNNSVASICSTNDSIIAAREDIAYKFKI